MNTSRLIEMVDGVWPEIKPDADWRELNPDESQALVLACALVLTTPYALTQASIILAAAFEVLTHGYQEASA